MRLRDNVVTLDTFNNVGQPPPARGEAAILSFAREDVLVLDEARAA